MERFKQFLKDRDSFGVAVMFSIQGRESHTTKVGGVVSLIVKIMVLMYSGLTFYQMCTYSNSTFMSTVDENVYDEAS